MNFKTDLARVVAEKTKLKQWQAEYIMDICQAEIVRVLVLGDIINIAGVGVINQEFSQARTVHMPFKSPPYRNAPAKRWISIKPYQSLLNKLNQ